MNAYSIRFDGHVLARGFWVYVIVIESPRGRYLYVGRTGDNSSPNASSPFSRIGQHLNHRANAKGNALTRNLRRVGIDPTTCRMEMIAVGPIFPEEREFVTHRPIRDQVAALEKAVATALRDRGHAVLGRHSCKCEPDSTKLKEIMDAIEEQLTASTFLQTLPHKSEAFE